MTNQNWTCPGCAVANDITFKMCCACGSYNRPPISIEVMVAAGFQWDPTYQGYPRWTHPKHGITALRSLWMFQENWEDHMASKINEANQMKEKPSEPFLQENKQSPGNYRIARYRGTLTEFWDGEYWSCSTNLIFNLKEKKFCDGLPYTGL